MSTAVLESPSIVFGAPVERPAVTRAPRKPNIYTKPVQEFIDAGEKAEGKAIPFEVPMGKPSPQKVKGELTGKDEYKDVLKELSKLRQAAPDGYGVRTAVDYDAPKKGVATVKFWVKAKKVAAPAETASE